VNDNAINGFFQTVKRRLSILERPLVTARGDGKSYIYSNFNPKYSQIAITILRTYYNFYLPYKTPGKEETPAQRLGIANRYIRGRILFISVKKFDLNGNLHPRKNILLG